MKKEKVEESNRMAQEKNVLQKSAAELARLRHDVETQAKQFGDLQSKIKELEEECECCVCLERQATTALTPCGHCFCGNEGVSMF